MNILQAIEESDDGFITNGNITFCIIDRKFFDVNMNQVSITNTDDLFAEFEIIS